jgi:Transcription initiation factor IID, 31kD subunit
MSSGAGAAAAAALMRPPPEPAAAADGALGVAPTAPPPPPAPELPGDAAAVRSVLKTMGVAAAEPRVVRMLLDFVYSYAAGVLGDAAAFAEQVGRPPGEVEREDVALATRARAVHSFVQAPPVESLRTLADAVNERRLPELDPRAGVGLRAPPDEHLLVQPSWRINPSAAAAAAAAAASAAQQQQQQQQQQARQHQVHDDMLEDGDA